MVTSTDCFAGATCSPPSNPGGRTVYDTFLSDAACPRFTLAAPAVPGSSETWKSGITAQHWRIDCRALLAVMAVMLRIVGMEGGGFGSFDDGRVVVSERRGDRRRMRYGRGGE